MFSRRQLQRDNRALEHEREELVQQVASLQLIKSCLEEQNKRLDGQVAELTGKLETVQSELETTLDTCKKTQAELNPVQIELESERTTSQQHESARATAEGQVTDLKNKLAQLEASHRAKLKKEIGRASCRERV